MKEDISVKDKQSIDIKENENDVNPQNLLHAHSCNLENVKTNIDECGKQDQPPLLIAESSPNTQKDAVLECVNSHREISQEDIDASPILLLKEEENGNLFSKKEIKINAGGMIGGRNARDGISIFGVENQSQNEFKIDFSLNFTEKFNYPYVFAIYFHTEKKQYFIKAYPAKEGENTILFIKLSGSNSLQLHQREIISCGNCIFQIAPIEEHKVKINVISQCNMNEGKSQVFDPGNSKDVTIGRLSSCNFAFPKDKSFSRIQTTISYDEQTQLWSVFDGSKAKESTNGTWVFATHSFPIKDNMLAEILTSKVTFSFVKNNRE